MSFAKEGYVFIAIAVVIAAAVYAAAIARRSFGLWLAAFVFTLLALWVAYSQMGDSAVQGERLGIIRFGSRVDVFLPAGSEPPVEVGDRASAGVTVQAELPQ